TLFKKVGKAVLNRHKKSETYKQVSDCLSSGGSVNRSLSDLRCPLSGRFLLVAFLRLSLPSLARVRKVTG
ncbi:hypothetical protein, partial [Shewanella algae]|uniref:hypothetical protein n=1 Tax=Shewanella algae TaxID=38313 RepID=UPI0031F50819